MTESTIWIFAYGSLLWRPGFSFSRSSPAVLAGWQRRFWQGSPDHRGTESAPGRVVTLIPRSHARCVGIAYQLHAESVDEVMQALDLREQGGYVREQLSVSLRGSKVVTATTWIAHAGNKNFLGPKSHCNIAKHIEASSGPSGSNVDYFRRLVTTLDMLGAEETHTRRIARWLTDRKKVFWHL